MREADVGDGRIGVSGPEKRLGLGHDIARMPRSWRHRVTVFIEELAWLESCDLELAIGEALCNWVGWRLPG